MTVGEPREFINIDGDLYMRLVARGWSHLEICALAEGLIVGHLNHAERGMRRDNMEAVGIEPAPRSARGETDRKKPGG